MDNTKEIIDLIRVEFDKQKLGPRYIQLANAIGILIEKRALGAGQALPAERDLSEQLDLARTTIRNAIDRLADNQQLERKRGSGNYVTTLMRQPLSVISSFTEDLKNRGLSVESRVFEKKVIPVNPADAMLLGVSLGESVLSLRRLRFANQEPLLLEHSIVPYWAVPTPSKVKDSLYDAMESKGFRPVRAIQEIRAVICDAKQASFLQIEQGSALLKIQRVGYAQDGRVVEVTRSFYRGDRYDFIVEMHD